MKTKSRLIASLLAVSLTASTLAPPALAGMVGTDALTSAEARVRVSSALEREAVRAQLESYGVSVREVQARVDALSDTEVAELAQKIDALPAGGSIVGAVVLVFLVLLLTDIAGLTKVFPFTRSIK